MHEGMVDGLEGWVLNLGMAISLQALGDHDLGMMDRVRSWLSVFRVDWAY